MGEIFSLERNAVGWAFCYFLEVLKLDRLQIIGLGPNRRSGRSAAWKNGTPETLLFSPAAAQQGQYAESAQQRGDIRFGDDG